MSSSKRTCCIPVCRDSPVKATKEGRAINLYLFPSSPWLKDRREIWIKFTRKKNPGGSPWLPKRYTSICNAHFVGGKKSEDPRHPAYNPTIYDPSKRSKDPKIIIGRYKRMVVRDTRQKEEDVEERQLEEEEAHRRHREKAASFLAKISYKKADSSGRTLKTEKEESDDISDSEMGVISDEDDDRKEEQVVEEPGTSVVEGPKQLLCLICCRSCPSNATRISGENANLSSFCDVLYSSVGDRDLFLESLETLDSLSVCPTCLSSMGSVVTANNLVTDAAVKVTELQQRLLKELRGLQEGLGQFYEKMQILEQFVRDSNEKRLQRYLLPPPQKNRGNGGGGGGNRGTGKPRHTPEIMGFRHKIGEQVSSVADFGKDLQKKVDCNEKNAATPFPKGRTRDQVIDDSRNDRPSSPLPSPNPPSPSDSDTESISSQTNADPPPAPASSSSSDNLKESTFVPKTFGTSTQRFTLADGTHVNRLTKHVWNGVTWEQVVVSETVIDTPLPRKERVACPCCKRKVLHLSSHQRFRCSATATARPAKKAGGAVYLCHQCSRAFNQMSHLRTHLSTVHSDERPFLCTECPQAFKTLQGLQSHKIRHSDDRPFPCRKGCGGAYKDSSTRKRHEHLCNGEGAPKRRRGRKTTSTTTDAPAS